MVRVAWLGPDLVVPPLLSQGRDSLKNLDSSSLTIPFQNHSVPTEGRDPFRGTIRYEKAGGYFVGECRREAADKQT